MDSTSQKPAGVIWLFAFALFVVGLVATHLVLDLVEWVAEWRERRELARGYASGAHAGLIPEPAPRLRRQRSVG